MNESKDVSASKKKLELSSKQVTDFLTNHPNFFKENPEILQSIMIPSRWSGDGVADIQKFMLEQLRGEINNIRDCAQDVIETSRTNMAAQTRTHTAVLALISATNIDQLTKVINRDFPLLLDIKVANIGFEGCNLPEIEQQKDYITNYLSGEIDQLVGIDKEVTLIQNMNDDGSIFGAHAELVHSAALARLRPVLIDCNGLLALGGAGNVFFPGQGTELISFIARVLERCIDRCLTIAE